MRSKTLDLLSLLSPFLQFQLEGKPASALESSSFRVKEAVDFQ